MIKKSKLKFDSNIYGKKFFFLRYRGRFLDDDDDDDLINMESSYHQIEKEEDFRYIKKQFLKTKKNI